MAMQKVSFDRVTVTVEHQDGRKDEYVFVNGPKSTGEMQVIKEHGEFKSELGAMSFTLPSWPARSSHSPPSLATSIPEEPK